MQLPFGRLDQFATYHGAAQRSQQDTRSGPFRQRKRGEEVGDEDIENGPILGVGCDSARLACLRSAIGKKYISLRVARVSRAIVSPLHQESDDRPSGSLCCFDCRSDEPLVDGNLWLEESER